VYIFMKNNPNKRKSEVADRFMAIGIKRAAIYRYQQKKKKVVVDLLQELTYFE
jgi:hypothetical protein